MDFEDAVDFFSVHLELPYNGKTYRVRDPGYEVGLACQRDYVLAMAVAAGEEIEEGQRKKLQLTNEEEIDLIERVLGDTLDEMKADQLPFAVIRHAGTAAWVWLGDGEEKAKVFWNSPKAPAAQKQPQDRLPSRSSSRTPRKRATASPGSRSSSTGD